MGHVGHIPITQLHAEGRRVANDNPLPVVAVYTRDAGDWDVLTLNDTADNNNDKTITVPATEEWQVLTLYVVYISVATVGDRQLQIDFRTDGGLVFFDVRPNAVQAASQQRHYILGPSLANLTAFYDTVHLQTPFPPTLFLRPSYSIRVYDNNSIDVTDTMRLYLNYAKRNTG